VSSVGACRGKRRHGEKVATKRGECEPREGAYRAQHKAWGRGQDQKSGLRRRALAFTGALAGCSRAKCKLSCAAEAAQDKGVGAELCTQGLRAREGGAQVWCAWWRA